MTFGREILGGNKFLDSKQKVTGGHNMLFALGHQKWPFNIRPVKRLQTLLPDVIHSSAHVLAAFKSKSDFGNSPLLVHNYNLPVFQWPGLEKPRQETWSPTTFIYTFPCNSWCRVIYGVCYMVYYPYVQTFHFKLTSRVSLIFRLSNGAFPSCTAS